jgi:hypothetical protein
MDKSLIGGAGTGVVTLPILVFGESEISIGVEVDMATADTPLFIRPREGGGGGGKALVDSVLLTDVTIEGAAVKMGVDGTGRGGATFGRVAKDTGGAGGAEGAILESFDGIGIRVDEGFVGEEDTGTSPSILVPHSPQKM